MKIDENNLDEPLEQIGDGINAKYFGLSDAGHYCISSGDQKSWSENLILTSRDWIFIKECIKASPLSENNDFVGRPGRHQEFLYDIVSNRHSGLDVDKIDYFARDQRRALKQAGEIDHRLVDYAFVAWGECSKPDKCFRCKFIKDDKDLENIIRKKKSTYRFNDEKGGMHLMICYPEKLVTNAFDFFKTRFRLHQEIYQNKAAKAVELMVCDILFKADLHKLIPSMKYPEGLPISRAMHDPECYLLLRDSIIDTIAAETDPSLREAQDLIKRLESRDHYKFVASQEIYGDFIALWGKTKDQIKEELSSMQTRHDAVGQLCSNDIIVEKRKIHHGMNEHNPVSLMRFLPKREMFALDRDINKLPEAKQIIEDNYSSHTPREFFKKTIRIFSRSRSPGKVELLDHTFRQWVETTAVGDDAPSCMIQVLEEEDYEAGRQPALCSQETPVRKHRGSSVQVSEHYDDSSPILRVPGPHAKRSLTIALTYDDCTD